MSLSQLQLVETKWKMSQLIPNTIKMHSLKEWELLQSLFQLKMFNLCAVRLLYSKGMKIVVMPTAVKMFGLKERNLS